MGSKSFWISKPEVCMVVRCAVHCFVGAFLSCLAAFLFAHPWKPGTDLRDYATAAVLTALAGSMSFFAAKFFPDTRPPDEKGDQK